MSVPGGDRGDAEVELSGGTANRGLVVRVGGTVRRPQNSASAAVHALLRHLERTGFEGAPRFQGEDAAGREVLSYVEGDVPIEPTPEWALTDEALTSVAVLLRRYHDATATFDPSPHTWRTRVPDRYGGRLVTHNDPNLDNVVFRDGEAVALIDFDLASPGAAEWDVASAVRSWVPLRDPRDTPPGLADRVPERLRLFLDAYGVTRQARRDVVHAVPAVLAWGYDIVREGARRGQPGYAHFWQGRAGRVARSGDWLQRHVDTLARDVSAG